MPRLSTVLFFAGCVAIHGLAGCTFAQPASFPTDRFPDAPFYEDIDRGKFMAIITDEVGRSVRISGTAEFVDEHFGGVRPFLLQLRDDESVIAFRGLDFRPGVGTYNIYPPEDDGATLSAMVGDARGGPPEMPRWRHYVDSGLLKVEAATEERLAGAFAFEATGWGQPTGLGPVVYIEGWFDATDGYNAR